MIPRRPALLALAVAALTLTVASAASAANVVATKQQLRGHLPELGSSPAMRVFLTAAAYDQFRASSGIAEVFPPSGALFMSWDRELLALYARGTDTGGRCLRAGTAAALAGDAVTLDLAWESGTCGAPATANHPFVLVSLSRTTDDGAQWPVPGRSVCASAPGADGSRACAQVAGATSPSPSPTSAPSAPSPSVAPSPAPTVAPATTRSPTPPPSPSATPTPTARTTAPLAVVPTSAPSVAEASPRPVEEGPGNTLVLAAVAAFAAFILLAVLFARGARRP